MELSFIQSSKLAIVAATGLAKDALHIYTGMAVFLLVLLWRRSSRTLLPLLAVLLVAVLGEWLDRRDDIASLGRWRWKASVHDLVNTLFWPCVLTLLLYLKLLLPGRHDDSPQD
ncbi:MAG: hypothetical protein ACRERR_09595 [Moraxellaceae bacterium]